VRAWLARHPRWTFHFTPTSCSWANAVETFFASLTRRCLQRGAFHSMVDLQAAINRYLGEHNRKPKPFVWTADPNRNIEKVNLGYQAMASDHRPLAKIVGLAPAIARPARRLSKERRMIVTSFGSEEMAGLRRRSKTSPWRFVREGSATEVCSRHHPLNVSVPPRRVS
jgi:hypothetical protein